MERDPPDLALRKRNGCTMMSAGCQCSCLKNRDDSQSKIGTIMLWKKPLSVESLTEMHADTAVAHLGIQFQEVGPDFIRARVAVDGRTRQALGLLHGGVSVVLAETLGSCGAAHAAPEGHRALGLEINANHVRSAASGWISGIARPLHVGRMTQVWQIDLRNDADQLICVSRITMAIVSGERES